MDAKRKEKRAWPAIVVLALSLLLHAAVLLMPLPGPYPESPRHDSPTMIVDLVSPPQQRPPARADQLPEPDQTPPEQAQQAENQTPPEPVVSAQHSADRSGPADASSAPPSSDKALPPDRIRAQLLSAARTLGRKREQDGEDNGLQYDAVPALPSRTGWLNQYTGRVDPSVDRWRGNDGSTNARFVTASGQVFCMRRRAPTMEEIINPSMSSGVTMIRGCSRERPAAPDRSNPWLRAPHGTSSN